MKKYRMERQTVQHLVLHKCALSSGRKTMPVRPGAIRTDDLDVGETFRGHVSYDPAPPPHPETEPTNRVIEFSVCKDLSTLRIFHPEIKPRRRNSKEVPRVLEEGEGRCPFDGKGLSCEESVREQTGLLGLYPERKRTTPVQRHFPSPTGRGFRTLSAARLAGMAAAALCSDHLPGVVFEKEKEFLM